MNNNYVLRHLSDILNYDSAMIAKVFEAADQQASEELATAWRAEKHAANFKKMPDPQMATFLNGLINTLRGKKDGPQPVPEQRLRNNIVMTKLRIAFDLKADDLLKVLALGGEPTNKNDLKALFRNPDNKHYRACKDETLTSFLTGLKVYNSQSH